MTVRVSNIRDNMANRNKGKKRKPTKKSPARQRGEKLVRKLQQGYNARKDEQLGMTRGKESGKKMSEAGRRKVAKATRKPRGSYGFKKKKA